MGKQVNPLQALYSGLWQLDPIRRTRPGRFIYKRLAKAGRAPSHEFTADFYGIKYHGNLTNNIDFNVFYYGAFEKPLLYFLSDAMRAIAPQSIFADIGANVGHHSLYMSRFARKVHAFEPYAPVRERLLSQIRLNNIDNIEVHAVGLSDTNTRLPFYAPTGRNAGIGSFDSSTTAKGNKSIGELELVKGDDYLAARNLDRFDMVKMDVEGFEKPAILGLRQTFRNSRPVMVCEVTYGKPYSFTSLEDMCQALPEDYSLFTFDTRKPDGSKARRRDAQSRQSGEYRVIPYTAFRTAGQDNIIACPNEKVPVLPTRNRGTR